MKTILIDKPGISKTELLSLLETQISSFSKTIEENNVNLYRIESGYTLSVNKRVLFMKYFLNAIIIAEDGRYLINFDTNAPYFKVREFESKVVDYLNTL